MRYIIVLILFVSSLYSLDVKKEYNALSSSQLKAITEAYNQGNKESILTDRLGIIIASMVYTESSAGRVMIGDNGTTFGLTHFSIERLRELLVFNPDYKHLNSKSDKYLAKELVTNHRFHIDMVVHNLRSNFNRYNNIRDAIVAHNGINKSKGFLNLRYEKKINKASKLIIYIIGRHG
jgi:hypothetical protein